MTTATSRFDRTRQAIGLVLGPLAFLVVLAAPTGLEPPAHRLAAVFAWVVAFWVTEAIPLPASALLGAALTVPLGIAGPKAAFAPFAHPIIFLFLGSFLIARAMALHNLDRRIALFVLSRPWVGDHPARILLVFGAIGAFLSMWMSNTATTAMMLPIAMGVLRTIGRSDGDEKGYATGLLLMIAFSCEIGGIATPVGTPPNLIAIGMIEEVLGRQVSFFQWMTLGVPVAVAGFALVWAVLAYRYTRGLGPMRGAAGEIRTERSMLGRWTTGERASLAAFLTAVVLWIAPGVVSLAAGAGSAAARRLGEILPKEPVAVLAALLLFVVPVDWPRRRFALDWKEAVRIDWGTILLFGGGLSLGTLAFETGLAGAIGAALERTAGSLPLAWAVLLTLGTASLMTEFMSNTATANLLVPTSLALGGSLAGDPILPALGATLGCSIAFCLPVATPPNAIVYGSGRVPLPAMLRNGILLDTSCTLLAWGVLMAVSGWIAAW